MRENRTPGSVPGAPGNRRSYGDDPGYACPLQWRPRQAILTIKPEQVASFLGKRITPQLAEGLGSRFTTRIEGTCIKHRLGKVSVRMYDKFVRVLRIETTTNDVSFFKHHRHVEHRDGSGHRQLAPLKKTIYRSDRSSLDPPGL